MEKENYRFYIQIRTELGIHYKTIFNELNSVRPSQAPSINTVYNWWKSFKAGHESLKDEPRSGRPITETTPSNIDRVRYVIDEDTWCSYDEIEAQTNLSRYVIFKILHDHLRMRKLASRWIPHELTEKNRKIRVEMCRKNLAKFTENKWRLGDVITGDESWFFHRQIGRKQTNASWVNEGESPKTVVRRDRFEA